MEQLIEYLFNYIQYLVFGSMGIAAIAYFINKDDDANKNIISLAKKLHTHWLNNDASEKLMAFRQGIGITIMVGALYYVGVLFNAAGYWFTEPARISITNCLYYGDDLHSPSGPQMRKPEGCSADTALWRPSIFFIAELLAQTPFFAEDKSLDLPFNHPVLPTSTPHYLRYAEQMAFDQTIIDDAKDSNLGNIVSDLLPFQRVARNSLLFFHMLATFSCLKIVSLLVQRLGKKITGSRTCDGASCHTHSSEKRGQIIICIYVLFGSAILFFAASGAYLVCEYDGVTTAKFGARVIEMRENAAEAHSKTGPTGTGAHSEKP